MLRVDFVYLAFDIPVLLLSTLSIFLVFINAFFQKKTFIMFNLFPYNVLCNQEVLPNHIGDALLKSKRLLGHTKGPKNCHAQTGLLNINPLHEKFCVVLWTTYFCSE